MAIKKTCLRVRKAVGRENKSFAFKFLYQSSVLHCLPSIQQYAFVSCKNAWAYIFSLNIIRNIQKFITSANTNDEGNDRAFKLVFF